MKNIEANIEGALEDALRNFLRGTKLRDAVALSEAPPPAASHEPTAEATPKTTSQP